ncbi:hypothetical protein NXV14_17775 [Bacteroides fragilis]|nr:hypothetical protein [Bacteroides fragilis]
MPGKETGSFSQQVSDFRNRNNTYQVIRLAFHVDDPLDDLPAACRIQMQGLCTRILGVKLPDPAVELLFQVIQDLPVLYQAALELQDIFLGARFPSGSPMRMSVCNV